MHQELHDDLFKRCGAMTGAHVRVLLADNSFAYGVLLAVDPETQHVALAHGGDEGKVRVKMLLRHGIRDIELDEEADGSNDAAIKSLLHAVGSSKEASSSESEDVVADRAERLGKFLDKNFVPFEREAKALVVFGGAGEILEPYSSPACCQSDNPRLHERLQQLLTSFFDDEAKAVRENELV